MHPETIRFGYVYAVAQFDGGKRENSLRTLEQMQRRYPANRDVLQLLAGYNEQMGRAKAAERYAKELQKLNAPQR